MVKRIAGSTIAIALLAILAWATWSQRVAITSALTQVSAGKLALILLVTLPVYPLSALTWHQLVRGLGGKISYKEALGVWMLSNIARLLPGTIWQWIGRGYLAGQYGVTPLQASLSIAYEITLAVVTALVVGFSTLPLWPITIHLPWWIGLAGLLPLIFIWPTTLPKIVSIYQRIRHQPNNNIPRLPFQSLLVGSVANLVQFFVSGLALWLLIGILAPQQPFSRILAYAGMYALAWLLGYVTIIAPGGLGVADASLAGLIAAQTSTAIGSAVALIYRVLLLISELIITLVAIIWQPNILSMIKSAKKENQSHE